MPAKYLACARHEARQLHFMAMMEKDNLCEHRKKPMHGMAGGRFKATVAAFSMMKALEMIDISKHGDFADAITASRPSWRP